MTKLDALTEAIHNGEFDNDLSYLADVIKERRNYQAQTELRTLVAGDTIVLDDIRPKYLIGAKATVVRINRTKVVATFNAPNGKFAAGTEVTIPAACVTKVG